MLYEWDDEKHKRNLATHGVDFADGEGFEWKKCYTEQDQRNEYGEDRFVSIGPIQKRLYVIVWTMRENKVRIISLRKANSREVKRYEQSENQDAR